MKKWICENVQNTQSEKNNSVSCQIWIYMNVSSLMIITELFYRFSKVSIMEEYLKIGINHLLKDWKKSEEMRLHLCSKSTYEYFRFFQKRINEID